MIDTLNLTDEQKEQLRKLLPMRVVIELDVSKGAPEIRGLCEESFSMAFYTDRAQIFWSSSNATSNIGGSFKVNGESWAADNHKKYVLSQLIFDPLDPECPIQVDWQDWLKDLSEAASKFNKRNARFVPRPHGLWQMRALVAEAQAKAHEKELLPLRDSHAQLEATIDSIKAIVNPSVGDDEEE